MRWPVSGELRNAIKGSGSGDFPRVCVRSLQKEECGGRGTLQVWGHIVHISHLIHLVALPHLQKVSPITVIPSQDIIIVLEY